MHGNLLALSSTADIAEIFHSFRSKGTTRRVRARARMTLNARLHGLPFAAQITGIVEPPPPPPLGFQFISPSRRKVVPRTIAVPIVGSA